MKWEIPLTEKSDFRLQTSDFRPDHLLRVTADSRPLTDLRAGGWPNTYHYANLFLEYG